MAIRRPRQRPGMSPPGPGIASTHCVARRAAGEPLQYVLGRWPFRTLDLMVDRRVLIPRPETEQVVEVALTELDAVAAQPVRRRRRDGRGRPRHRVGGHRPVAGRRAAPPARSGPPMCRPTPSRWPPPTWPGWAGGPRPASGWPRAGGGRLSPTTSGPGRPGRVQPAVHFVRRHDQPRLRGRRSGSRGSPSRPGRPDSRRCRRSSPAPAGWLRPGGSLVVEIAPDQSAPGRAAWPETPAWKWSACGPT